MTPRSTEAQKFLDWADRVGLSIAQLAKLTGYAVPTLYWYARGLTPPRTAKHIAGKQVSKPIEAPEWRRFRNICAGVEYQLKLGKQFDW